MQNVRNINMYHNTSSELYRLKYQDYNKIRLLQYIAPYIVPIHNPRNLLYPPRNARECDIMAYLQYLLKECYLCMN